MLEIMSRSGVHDFDILREGQLVASLRKKGWFHGPAKALINDEAVKFVSESIFSTRYKIYKNEKPCGQIEIDWVGNIHISLMRALDAGQDIFKLKRKTWSARHYVLLYAKREPLLQLKGEFRWAEFSYHYDIEEGKHDYPDEAINELLVYCAFALKLASFHSY